MEEVNFSLIWAQLQAILAPIVGTIASAFMGTELFKRLLPNVSARTVTWGVWAVVGLVVWLILKWMPFWFVVVIALVTIGLYAGALKPLMARLGLTKEKETPIGGGGGSPVR